MWDFIDHIKLIIGVTSSVMLILSAFRYEVIDREEYDNEQKQEQAYYNNNNGPNFTIDKQSLDALAKFDRNVRHLQIKGKEASRSDFSAIVPDFKDALSAATKVLHELQQLKLTNHYYNNKDGSRKSYKKRNSNNNGQAPFVKKVKKTFVFSIPFGSKVYTISLYWPKLLRLFIGDTAADDD